MKKLNDFSFPLESFTNTEFTREVVEEAGICQNCFIKFNEYDEHKSLADQIQADLVALFDTSNVSNHIKQEIKVEASVFEEESLLYETVEDAQREEAVEEMYITGHGADLEADGGNLIVEYGWVNQKPYTSDFKLIKPKTVKSDETFEAAVIQLDDNQRFYQCEICMRSFKEKSKLKTHREIHTTERNVICPVSNLNKISINSS